MNITSDKFQAILNFGHKKCPKMKPSEIIRLIAHYIWHACPLRCLLMPRIICLMHCVCSIF